MRHDGPTNVGSGFERIGANVFRKSLGDLCGPILAWGIGLLLLAAVIVCLFSSVRDNGSLRSIDAIVQGLSPLIRAAILDVPSVTDFEGFMSLEFFHYLPLFLAIFAIVEGSAAIALEEERRTIDLLMAQPVRRWRVVVEKFAAQVVAMYAIAGLAGLGLVAATRFVPVEAPWYRLVLAAANAVPPALVVGALSLLGSCAMRRRRYAAIIGATFLAASFFLNVLGQIVTALKPWRILSVFYSHRETRPLTGDLVPTQVVWLLAATAILLVAAVVAFRRKELAV
jgi:ABC-2 type transport system permease protein